MRAHYERLAGVVSLLAAVLLPLPSAAQVPAGAEFRVNVATTGEQRRPSVAATPGGGYIIVWHGQSAADPDGVVGRRFDAAGTALGAEFQVNGYTTGRQAGASVVADGKGNFVVVWAGPDGNLDGVFGQRFDASGTRRGAEFQVNTFTSGNQGYVPRVGLFLAGARDGRFVVVWTSAPGTDGSGTSVQARRYDGQGLPLGDEFRVNAYTTSDQFASSVTMGSDGSFVVGFTSQQDGSGFGAIASRFNAAGNPVGVEFVVNSQTAGGQYAPVANMASDGSLLVHFAQLDTSSFGLRARRFDAANTPVGAEFQVNTQDAGFQYGYSNTRDRADNFIVAWSDMADVFARRFRADGTGRGLEFLVNTFTTGTQAATRVASDDVGNFVVAWESFPQDGSAFGVYAQRFGGLRPTALNVNTAGNLVWEPGESVDMRPTWRNVNGAAQTFGGTLTNLTGPAGATYTITDGTATYGTVPNNTSQPCTDCYTVAVDNPPTRPAQHWDASAVETITPDPQGQQKIWSLHIGGSFTDVPPANVFYRFVETLLHYSITGGCGGTSYCPASNTSRDQMAVFVLVAKEGAGFTPPACGTPVFADVPASSPFCRFIEELARRNVVSGCGGGNYCPAAPVTREQMAVFVLRTLDPALNPPACVAGGEQFADVPASSAFCKWIEELARRGVVTGCGNGNYCPADAVTREQMGVFISATFGLTLYGP